MSVRSITWDWDPDIDLVHIIGKAALGGAERRVSHKGAEASVVYICMSIELLTPFFFLSSSS